MYDIPLSCFQTPQPSKKARAGSPEKKTKFFPLRPVTNFLKVDTLRFKSGQVKSP